MKYLSVGADAKTVKGEKQGYLTGILYMAPHTLAGGRSLCPFSTAGCRAVCLYSAGRGGFNSVQEARIRKTKAFLADPGSFVEDLFHDICDLQAKAQRDGMKMAIRLNGTTDIQWENLDLIQNMPDVQFYDYTKWPVEQRNAGYLPANYHLTYSYSESPKAAFQAGQWRAIGVNTAVVFRGELPPTFLGAPVIDGDLSDLRFTDPSGVIVGLVTKGKARKDDEVGAGYFVQKGVMK